MNKFKFGDLVFDESLGVCVVLNVSEHFATIQNANGNFNSLANPAELKPVPHPDTARLDFLISKGEAAFKQNEVGDWAVFDPHSHSQLADAKWSGFGNSPRAAIDAAMQQSD